MLFFMFLIAFSAFCNVNLELVNTQEIELDNIIQVNITYSSEKVSLFMGTTNKLIIKEYMNINNNKYYARITKSGNNVSIENGRRPFWLFFNSFNRRLEVYLPISYSNTINIKTSSGRIESSVELFGSILNIENSSGGISLNSITGDVVRIKTTSGSINISNMNGEVWIESSSGHIEMNQVSGILTVKNSSGRINGERIHGDVKVNTGSGNIVFSRIEGNVSAESTSGTVQLNLVNGSVNAKTTSGSIHCTFNENVGNISINTSSGSVRLNLPRSLDFNFYSRTSSGRLTTPFPDKLFSPVNDRNLTQGIIGNNISENIPTINIRTRSGSIEINWI